MGHMNEINCVWNIVGIIITLNKHCILIMDDFTELEVDEFPHVKDRPSQLKEINQAHYNISSGQKLSPFRKRFPWLAFKNPADEERYSYLGKYTQKNTPFLISFDVKSTSIEKNRREIVQNKMQKSITALVDNDHPQQQKIFSQLRKIDCREFNDDLIGQAYLLIGLAKPSITINEIFDTVFYQIQQAKVENQRDNNSEEQYNSSLQASMTDYQSLQGYFAIKKSWQYKRKSYEFHKLMCRAYLHYQEYFKQYFKAQQQREQWEGLSESQQKLFLSNRIFNQLFSKMRSRQLILFNQATSLQSSISDQQYYNYFFALFKNHGRQILSKINTFQKKNSSSTTLQITLENSEIKKITLQKFDYRKFSINLCGGVKLSEQSIANIIAYHRKNHQKIMSELQFKSKNQRLESLTNLAINKYHSFGIKLVPIGETKSYKIPEIDNYLIVVERRRRIRQTQLNLQFTLSEMISDEQNNKESLMGSKQFKLIKHHIFQSILDIKNLSILSKQHSQLNQLKKVASRSKLLEKLSFNPKNINFDYRNRQVYPKFQYALSQYLQIGKLPLSCQQKLLALTPRTDIDLYEIIQNVYQDFKITLDSSHHQQMTLQQKIQYLQKLCENLSSQRIVFTLDVSAAREILNQFCNIFESKLLDKEKLIHDYHQLQNQFVDKAHEIQKLSQMEKDKMNFSLFKEQYKQVVDLCLKSISKSELLKIVMLSLFDYQLSNKQKYIFLKPKNQEEFYFDEREEPYQLGSEQDQKIMYQLAMILLICCRVITCVDFSLPKKKEVKSVESGKTGKFNEADHTIKVIIENYFMQNLIEYFKSLFLIASAQIQSLNAGKIKTQNNLPTINSPVQLDQGPLQSLFYVYEQLMLGKQDHSNEGNKALIKAGLINNVCKEGLQIMQRLINIDQQLQYLQDYKVNLFDRKDTVGTFGEKDLGKINIESIYNQIEEKYTKIYQLYYKTKEKYSQIKIENFMKTAQISNPRFLKTLQQTLKTTYNRCNYVKTFYKRDSAGHHGLADIKTIIIRIRNLKQQMKNLKPNSNECTQKKSRYAGLLTELYEYVLSSKKEDHFQKKSEPTYRLIVQSKKQLNDEITKECRHIEEAQINLFNQIYFNCHSKKKLIKTKSTQEQLQAQDLKTLRLLMFFLYSQPKFDKNYIQRLNSPLTIEQVNYELVRMMNMLTQCNIEMWERQSSQNK